MKSYRLLAPMLAMSLFSPFAARAQTAPETPVTIAVDSPAFVFSPGNWSGDQGRGGSVYRQTWNPGAYFRVTFSSSNPNPAATLRFDTSTYDTSYPAPTLTLNIDGAWTPRVPCTSEVKVPQLAGTGNHILTVYLSSSEQRDRWGTTQASGKNVVRVSGLSLDAGSKAGVGVVGARWALEIGDSITEGTGADAGRADNLSAYSFLVGQGLKRQGIEYGVSACGWSGWLFPGDNPLGDVPGYYVVSGSANGSGGVYHDDISRWNKIDGQHSLLDSRGHLSAYGGLDQEPSIITINYGTNDGLHDSNLSDTQSSITQALGALRAAAPKAKIFMIMPFGRYIIPTLQAGIEGYRKTHKGDKNLIVIDLGETVPRSLNNSNNYWGDLHPNQRAHAVFGAQILSDIERNLG